MKKFWYCAPMVSFQLILTHLCSFKIPKYFRKPLKTSHLACNFTAVTGLGLGCKYFIYYANFACYCVLVECSRPIRFFIASLRYNDVN